MVSLPLVSESPWWFLGYIFGDEILPTYVGTIFHKAWNKDSYLNKQYNYGKVGGFFSWLGC